MQTVQLKNPAVIDGAVRYPAEGPLTVTDEIATQLRANDNIEGDDDDGDGLEATTVADLNTLAAAEGVELNGVTKKAEIIAAIRAHRIANPPAPAA